MAYNVKYNLFKNLLQTRYVCSPSRSLKPWTEKSRSAQLLRLPESGVSTPAIPYEPFRVRSVTFQRYTDHLVACIAEWVLGVGFFVVISTFFYELTRFEVNTLTLEQQQFLVPEASEPVLLHAKALTPLTNGMSNVQVNSLRRRSEQND